uniref:Uncharacterized protein n=1 Tax=Globisporangium ultimum (strain ATCC 200006 / CBS 805.95 / DAOM BR144) TaxID=431595 RepID=K3X339_GLOUD
MAMTEMADVRPPRPEITLRRIRFNVAVVLAASGIMGLTVLFYYGISITKIVEPVGDSKQSEVRLQLYNTLSGVAMGVFECLIGLSFANFFPAFVVYVHNLKWWPGDDPLVKTSKAKKMLLLLFFPLVMVAIGSSFSTLQAGSSTVGVSLQMDATTLGVDRENASSVPNEPIDWLHHEDTILKTAVLRRSTPFRYVDSNCSEEFGNRKQSALKRLADIDSTSAVFGFPLKEWSREVYPQGSPYFNNASLELNTAFELVFQGQALLERSIGGLVQERCRLIGEDRDCRTRNGTAFDNLFGYLNGTKKQTRNALQDEILQSLQNTFFGDLDETTLYVEYLTFPFSSQVTIQAMSFSIAFKADYEYGIDGDTVISPEGCVGDNCTYLYRFLDRDTFCGKRACIFPDWHAQQIPRKHASMMQYAKKCEQSKSVYDANLGVYIPADCEREPNAAFLYGFGSRIFADTLGVDDEVPGFPHIQNPRRYLSFTLGKLSWEFADVADALNATCEDTVSNKTCQGLALHLNESKRDVLLSKEYVPAKLSTSDFRQPINLFQLITPIINTPRVKGQSATLEVLYKDSFNGANAVTSIISSGDQCSSLADAYMQHINVNQYHLAQTFQPMYMAAVLYIFQSASVTMGTNSNFHFQGDRAVSKVKLVNTRVGLYSIVVGCIILLLLALVTLLFPNERARLTPVMGKNARAERFIDIQTEVYPNLLYKKRILIGKTGEALKLSAFAVESVGLHHKMDDEDVVSL